VGGLTVVLSGGEVVHLRRGECRAEDGKIRLVPEQGEERVIDIPPLELPETKHTAGYYLNSGDGGCVDAVDLFIGSEGTLGVIAEVELKLTFEPPERMYVTAFLPDEKRAVEFVEGIRTACYCTPLAIEYIGPNAMRLLREKRKEEGKSSGVPALPDDAFCSVYVELSFDGDGEFRRCYKLLEGELQRCGAGPEHTWAGCSSEQLRIMKEFRHAVPEKVNSIIGMRKRKVPSIHKIGTDMAVPDEHLEDVMSLYRRKLEELGLEYLIFGHIGDNHLHVNILPRSKGEVDQAMDTYSDFAAEVVRMGGSVSAEHGIGRIKRDFLRVQFGDEEIAAMQEIKRALDPAGIFNPGVLF
jgi:D-lactate dehydrogenase (cytochrome)